ncbi:MAG: TIM44-like domain-containing protein [Bacteroidota bacterium]|nr:TIM44-like domain-containing protein [Bacteroidota bacterium]
MSKNKILNTALNFLIVFLVTSIIITLGSGELFARPGGGHSYSGGGGGGFSGGGGGGDGGLLLLLFYILPPEISIPLVIGVIIFRYVSEQRKKKNSGTISSAPPISSRIKSADNTKMKVADLKKHDPNFSEVLFIDFVASLFNKYHSYFGKNEFKNLSPFVSKSELNNSASIKSRQDVKEIVIGSINIIDVRMSGNYIDVITEIRANYTLFKNNKGSRLGVTERWKLTRKKGILSLEPDAMRRLTCPSCGGSTDITDAGTCQYCGNKVEAGEQQWFLSQRRLTNSHLFSSAGLAHYEQEHGTSLPTVYQPGLNSELSTFAARAGVDMNSWKSEFQNDVVSAYFMKIYTAWSNNDLNKVRNLLTDRVYENFMFWIDAYIREGLSNKLEQVRISDIRLSKVTTDKYYDTVTVRIFASALDYVENSSGKVIGGSSRRARKFSEYWTFIRKAGVRKDNFDFSKCPSCGAPADKIGKSGVCEYCNSKISNGDFSWVLAIITQDEEYVG